VDHYRLEECAVRSDSYPGSLQLPAACAAGGAAGGRGPRLAGARCKCAGNAAAREEASVLCDVCICMVIIVHAAGDLPTSEHPGWPALAASVQALLPPPVWHAVSVELYTTFWSLSLYDIHVPVESCVPVLSNHALLFNSSNSCSQPCFPGPHAKKPLCTAAARWHHEASVTLKVSTTGSSSSSSWRVPAVDALIHNWRGWARSCARSRRRCAARSAT